MVEPKIYEVGGAIRDDLLGIPTKDVDFTVVAESFKAMHDYIEVWLKFRIFMVKPEFVTIRAGVPEGHPLRARCKDADFVLARKDGPSTDGRRPDYVTAGTLEDDLARRDFTVNAIARDPLTNELIDPHGGIEDLKRMTLKFVGDPMARIREDGLRVLRGLRFHITKGFRIEDKTFRALYSIEAAEMLKSVSKERIREELEKMFKHNTVKTLNALRGEIVWACFGEEGAPWLLPTFKS